MRAAISFGSSSGAMSMVGSGRANSRAARRESIMLNRVEERRRELQKREKENERIGKIMAQISEVKASSTMSAKLAQRVIAGLQMQIEQIYEAREAREIFAVEMEMARKHIVFNDLMQPEEKPENGLYEEPKEPEEAKEENQRLKMSSLMRLVASKENLAVKSQVRATLAMEAGQLRQAMESPNSNTTKMGFGGGEAIISSHSGFGGDDFRNRQYNQLIRGIAGMDAAIKSTISNMYRESAKLQEEYLAKECYEDNE